MNFLPEALESYVMAHTNEEPEVLKALNRETHLKVLVPQMLSGHYQGKFLSMISHMINPDSILEIGTYTGYSAICLASGLSNNGRLHTIDIKEELREMAFRYFKKMGLDDKITMHIGEANQIIPEIDETFDLVFIDADKVNYSSYYDLVFDKVRVGGYIIADNVLWDGKVLEENMDNETEAIKAFNLKILSDKRIDNILVPIRDGLMIGRKIER